MVNHPDLATQKFKAGKLIANKRGFLIKIFIQLFFWFADQYDTPFIAFYVVSFFVGRPDHFELF